MFTILTDIFKSIINKKNKNNVQHLENALEFVL